MEGGGEEGGPKMQTKSKTGFIKNKSVTQNTAKPEYQQQKLDQTKPDE